jgi:hypothetical protein
MTIQPRAAVVRQAAMIAIRHLANHTTLLHAKESGKLWTMAALVSEKLQVEIADTLAHSWEEYGFAALNPKEVMAVAVHAIEHETGRSITGLTLGALGGVPDTATTNIPTRQILWQISRTLGGTR